MIDHVRSIIIEYLAGRFPADELATRLPDAWELDQAGDREAHDLTLRAVGYLAEYQRGDRSDDDLREDLVALVSPAPAALAGQKTEIRRVRAAEVSTQLVNKPLLEVSA